MAEGGCERHARTAATGTNLASAQGHQYNNSPRTTLLQETVALLGIVLASSTEPVSSTRDVPRIIVQHHGRHASFAGKQRFQLPSDTLLGWLSVAVTLNRIWGCRSCL
jgi:hypothetical protein